MRMGDFTMLHRAAFCAGWAKVMSGIQSFDGHMGASNLPLFTFPLED